MRKLNLKEIFENDPLGIFNGVLIRLPFPLSKYRKKGHKNMIKNYLLIKEEIFNNNQNLEEKFLKQYISFTSNGRDIEIGISVRNNYLIIWSSKKDNLNSEAEKANTKLSMNKIYASYSSIRREENQYGSLAMDILLDSDIVDIKKVIKYFFEINK